MDIAKNYFTLDEDFETIIKKALPDKTINKIRSVTTGWTNIDNAYINYMRGIGIYE